MERPTLVDEGGDTFVNRIGDALTLVGVALTPLFGKEIFGLAYADIVLFFASLVRMFQWFTEGIPISGIRRQSFLLGVVGLLCFGGLLSGIVNNDPFHPEFIRAVTTTTGSLVLVVSFGGGRQRSYRPLIVAFALGTIVLGFSAFTGPALEGRQFGWAIHPNQLGHSCMMGFAATVWLVDNARSRGARLFWAGAALLNLVAIDLSGSRGAILGIAAGTFAYLCLRGSSRLRFAAAAGAWAAALLLLAGLASLPAPIERFFIESSTNTGSNAARTELLDQDYARINQDPVFGTDFHDTLNVHVVYFQGWIGGGVLGAIALFGAGAAMIGLPLLYSSRPRDLALACGATAVAVAWIFTNILTLRDQWIFLAVAFGSAPSLAMLRPVPSDVETPAEALA